MSHRRSAKKTIDGGPEIAWKLRTSGTNPGVAWCSMSILVGLHHATRYSYDRPIKSWPADRALTAGAAYPHAHSELLAHGDAGAAFRELAAGPARQLAGALRFSGKDERIRHHRRSHRRHGGDQSVRLLRRALCGQMAIRISRGRTERGSRRFSSARTGRPALARVRAFDLARRRARRSTSSSSSISACSR